ncbi:magnesium transporter [Deinococcus murrayi]|uniref:magnesium transporter n=1 Tax=Deinococcus murrayi TaxID=68910 RepID=UPI000A8A7487|nr:magnesium transporter [Deinococcus murrayi]
MPMPRGSVQEALRGQGPEAVRAELLAYPAPDLADLLRGVPPTERAVLFRLLPPELAARTFAAMPSHERDALVYSLSAAETQRLLADLDPDDRTHLFEELPGRVTQRLLTLLGPEDLTQAQQLLGYPPQSVGRLMTPEYVAVRPRWTVAQALAHVRERGGQAAEESLAELYVVDDDWRLLDALSLARFVLARPEARVADLMDGRFTALRADDDRETAVRVMERARLTALPVVDAAGVLVGAVTADDVLGVARAEATEDFQLAGAVTPLPGGVGGSSALGLYRRRIGWLVVLVFVNLVSGAVIARYEDVIAEVVALVFFLPLLIGSSGNAGSQASTLMVRALATGDVRAGDWGRLLVREVGVSALLGVTMAAAVSAVGLWRGGTEVALIVALTMVAVVILGSVIGLSLPFVLARLRLDPATASGPLVTSLADISGVLVYFTIATWLLGRLAG